MTKNVIVLFGGAGYLGRALTAELLSRGCEVIVADLAADSLDPRAKFKKVDIRNYAEVLEAIPIGALVANFAGIADLNLAKNMPRECIEINVIGHFNILKACAERQVRKICYASSAYVYSLHGSFYRISKRTCEEYTVEFGKKHQLDYLIIRYGSIYGGASNSSNGMHRLVHQALTHGKLYYDGHPTDSREFIHVSDASEVTSDLLLGSETNSAYILTGTERFNMQELFSMIVEILHKKIDVEFGCKDDSDHYKMTQYNFVPIQAKRISKVLHVDLGNGLMNLINNLHISNENKGKNP